MRSVWLGLAVGLLAAGAAAEDDLVELIPNDRAGWSVGNLFAPIGGLLRGDPDYWYENRVLRIDTTPPGAVIDLFYVRRGFQKGYEQADAPVQVRLPSRVEAGAHDAVTIRALLDGYRQGEATVPVRSSREEVMIELQPLPNSLVALTHVSLAGRASLGFVTMEPPNIRFRKVEDGLQIVLTETALRVAPEDIEGMRGGVVAAMRPQQLGEDLVVQLALAEGARDVEARSRQSFDPLRRLHRYSLDLVPADAGADGVRRALEALGRIRAADVEGCSAAWDRSLRQQLEPAALARALSAKGEFTDRYLRGAMRRLGGLSPDGAVRLADGSSFRIDVPIELMAAASQPHEVEGYLALLRALVRELEPADGRREALRGLLAPELTPSAFGSALDAANAAERECERAS